MADRRITRRKLALSLRQLCLHEDDLLDGLNQVYREHLKDLEASHFPEDLRRQFGEFQKYLNELIIYHRSSQPSPEENLPVATDAKAGVKDKVVEKLISLHEDLSSHRAPHVDPQQVDRRFRFETDE